MGPTPEGVPGTPPDGSRVINLGQLLRTDKEIFGVWPRRPGEASWPMPWAACCLRPPLRSLFEPSVQLFLLPMPALGPCAVSSGSGGSAAQQAALAPDASRTAAKRLCAEMVRLSAATAEVLLD